MRKNFAAFAAVLTLSCPAWATVTTTTNSASYVGNGSTTAFTVPFKFLANADLVVTVAGVTKALGSDYSVKGAGAATGTVTTTSPPAIGAAVVITRKVPLTQGTSLRQVLPFPAGSTIENALDRATMQIQQLSLAGTASATTSGILTADDWARFNNTALQPLNSFQAPGTGTVVRTIGDKLGDLISVKDFNVKCDGTTNDTANLNLAGASGKHVVFPAGTCLVSSSSNATITLSNGTVFEGSGNAVSTITFSGTPEAASTAAIRLDSPGSGISNLAINVTAGTYGRTVNLRADNNFATDLKINVSTASLPTTTAHYVFFSTPPPAGPTYIFNGRIERNDVVRTNVPFGDGVQASFSQGLRVLNNRIHDSVISQELATCSGQKCGQQSWGIYISSGCFGALVQGNTIENNNHSGIHFNEAGSVAANVGRRAIGNWVHDDKYVCMSIDFATGAIVQGNYLARCDVALNIINSVATVVSGNHLEDIQNVTPPGSANQPMMTINAASAQTVVTGNTFGTRGTALYGIDTAGTDVLVNNNIFGVDRPQIAMFSTGAGFQAIGNKIGTTTDTTAGLYVLAMNGADNIAMGNVVNMGTVGVGIRLGAANDAAIGNKIIGGVGGVWMPSASTTGALAEANIIMGGSGAQIADSGVNSTKRGNKFSNGASRGAVALVAGTATVSTAEIQAGDAVMLTHTTTGGTVGHLTLGTVTAGTSFVINSSSGTDTSTVAWEIRH